MIQSLDYSLIVSSSIYTFKTLPDSSSILLEKLAKLDSNILTELINEINTQSNKEHRSNITYPKLGFIWESETSLIDAFKIIDLIKPEPNSYWCHSLEFLFESMNTNFKDHMIEFNKSFVDRYASDVFAIENLMGTYIKIGLEDAWKNLLEVFLMKNTSLEDFQNVGFELHSAGGYGNVIFSDIFSKHLKKVYEVLCTLRPGSTYIGHVRYIKNRIDKYNQGAKEELRSYFADYNYY